MPRSLSSVSHFLTRGSLPRLQRRLAEQQRLLQLIRQLLPEALKDHCISTILQDSSLTLLTDSPVWASRLRFLGDSLPRQLRQRGLKCDRVKVKVFIQSRYARHKQLLRPARPLSEENGELLRATAQHIGDPDLREALLRLSRHAKG